jgi:hypothetical protein
METKAKTNKRDAKQAWTSPQQRKIELQITYEKKIKGNFIKIKCFNYDHWGHLTKDCHKPLQISVYISQSNFFLQKGALWLTSMVELMTTKVTHST